VEQAARGAQNRFALFLRIALAEHAVERLARIALHRQRLRRRPERDHAAGLAAQFQRRQRRVLPEVLRGNLIDGDTGTGLGVALARGDAVQPRLLDDAVRAGAFTALVPQAADHGDVFAEWLERLENEGKVRIASHRL